MASTISTKATLEADIKKNMVVIAQSKLTLEIKDFDSTHVPFTVSEKNVQLMEFSDASW